jgi:hypothetical protein
MVVDAVVGESLSVWAWQVAFLLPSTDEHTITTTMPIGQPCSTYLNILNKEGLLRIAQIF